MHNKIKVGVNGCRQAKIGFERDVLAAFPQIGGQRATQAAAIGAAAKILGQARRPLISGLGTDVEGVREAVHLAEKSKAILDHGDSTGFDDGVRVLQSKGWYMTTLAELRNRADLVVIVGADVVDHYENFLRRYVHPKQTLHLQPRSQRRVVYVGDISKAPNSTPACVIDRIDCEPRQLLNVLGALRASISGRKLQATRIGKTRIQDIELLSHGIRDAQYPVFVWAPAHFENVPADLAIQSIIRIIDDLNKTQRAAGLALGGDNGGMSAANACAWLTGYPLHVSFAGKTIDYDPVQYRTRTLAENDAIDVLVWIDAIGKTMPPATRPNVKRIVLGLPGTNPAPGADVFIPVGTPGVDYKGSLVRTDSVISIQLDQLRPSPAPSVRKIVGSIIQHL